MESMREGGKGFYTYRYLGSQGFLPNYAFPSRSTTVSFFDNANDLSRNTVLALREYAPGNSIYYRGPGSWRFTIAKQKMTCAHLRADCKNSTS